MCLLLQHNKTDYCEVDWNADFVHAFEAEETRRRQQEQRQSFWQQQQDNQRQQQQRQQQRQQRQQRGPQTAQDPREFFEQVGGLIDSCLV